MKEIKAFAVIDSSSQIAEKYIKAKTEEVKLEIKQCEVVTQ